MPWSNLFRDRPAEIAAIDDAAVSGYVAHANYAALPQRLAAAPHEWDVDGSGKWDGYLPDTHYQFDERGFERAPDGTPSGYRVL